MAIQAIAGISQGLVPCSTTERNADKLIRGGQKPVVLRPLLEEEEK